jgi:hypothetical protein
MQPQDHLDKVYSTYASDAVIWFHPLVAPFFEIIEATSVTYDVSTIHIEP